MSSPRELIQRWKEQRQRDREWKRIRKLRKRVYL